MRWLLVLLVLPTIACADYDEGSRSGWWWYQEPPAEESTLSHSPEEQLSTKALAKALEEALETAVASPDPHHVHRYLTLQDLARRRALAFANTTQLVLQHYPGLSTRGVYPVTTPGNLARITQVRQEQHTRLQQERERFGLVLVSRSSCLACQEQERILGWFRQEHGWDWGAIDLDQDHAFSGTLPVETVPAVFLLSRLDGQLIPLTSGGSSAQEVEERLYRTIRYLAGETTPEQFTLLPFENNTPADPLAGSSRR